VDHNVRSCEKIRSVRCSPRPMRQNAVSCGFILGCTALRDPGNMFYSRDPMAFSTSVRISHDFTSSFILLWSG